MTSLILATVICGFIAPQSGPVDLVAKYQHEWPAGESYTYSSTTLLIAGYYEVEAEAWPVYIRLTQDGEQIGQCTYDPAIFMSGFETGDTGEWD